MLDYTIETFMDVPGCDFSLGNQAQIACRVVIVFFVNADFHGALRTSSLVIGLVKTQFSKARLVWLGGDDSFQIKNAAIVKKGSEAILDNGQFLIILRNHHPTVKS